MKTLNTLIAGVVLATSMQSLADGGATAFAITATGVAANIGTGMTLADAQDEQASSTLAQDIEVAMSNGVVSKSLASAMEQASGKKVSEMSAIEVQQTLIYLKGQ